MDILPKAAFSPQRSLSKNAAIPSNLDDLTVSNLHSPGSMEDDDDSEELDALQSAYDGSIYVPAAARVFSGAPVGATGGRREFVAATDSDILDQSPAKQDIDSDIEILPESHVNLVVRTDSARAQRPASKPAVLAGPAGMHFLPFFLSVIIVSMITIVLIQLMNIKLKYIVFLFIFLLIEAGRPTQGQMKGPGSSFVKREVIESCND